jgi:hypothetical protein
VRTLLASALVLLACGCADRPSRPSGAGATPDIPAGPDPIVLRVAQGGGVMTARAYPALDSVLWRSAQRVPPLARILAFGPEDGWLAAIDTAGAPVRIDLRLGTVAVGRARGLQAPASGDGGITYALTASGDITRDDPSGGTWSLRPPLPVQVLLPQPDGALVGAGAAGDELLVWRVRPPGTEVADRLAIAVGGDAGRNGVRLAATATTVGDRVYLAAHETLVGVETRGFTRALSVDLGDPVVAVAATPSGDRLFVALEGDRALRVVDRFAGEVTARVRLPGPARALRMDPVGRLLLARGAEDTVWVVSLAEGAVLGAARSAWRPDLPQVLPDGRIATVSGTDVVLVDGLSLARVGTLPGAAADHWHLLRWNGFRPRAAGLDEPVRFRSGPPRDSAAPAPAEGAARGVPDSARETGDTTPPPPATASPASATAATDTAAGEAQWTVSFAAVLNEQSARDLAGRIRVDGQRARVVAGERDGRPLYRVLLGPFATRAQAERVARASGQPGYWIFQGAPR